MQIKTGEKQHNQVGRLIVLAFISFLLLWVAIPAKTWADDPLPDAALRDVLGENDIVVDNTDTAVTRTGTWSTGTSNPGKYFGSNYEFVNGGTDQVQTIKYTPSVPQTGVYEVLWCSAPLPIVRTM
jgi:hypothetical protein